MGCGILGLFAVQFCAAMGAQNISDQHTITFSNVKLVKVAEAAN